MKSFLVSGFNSASHELAFFRQCFSSATPVAPHIHQQSTTSCAKQELQPNKNQLKSVHFQEILSATINGQPVTKNKQHPPPPLQKKEEERMQYYSEKKVKFPYYEVVLEVLNLNFQGLRAKHKI